MKNLIFIFIISAICFSSCSYILSSFYGVKQLKKFDEEKYYSFLNNIDSSQINFYKIVSDSIKFNNIINLGRNNQQKNDFGQPVQILYFHNDELVSFHANCYAEGGLRKINWNTSNRFNFFPPKSAVPIDSLLTNYFDYKNIYPQLKHNKYNIIIFWTLMLEKISKDAIETTIDNVIAFEKKDSTAVHLINIDKYYIKK